MNDKETLDSANTFVINKEYWDLKDMQDALEVARRIEDPREETILKTLRNEIYRVKPEKIFDHEEVFIGTGQYTTGRLNHKKPNLKGVK